MVGETTYVLTWRGRTYSIRCLPCVLAIIEAVKSVWPEDRVTLKRIKG